MNQKGRVALGVFFFLLIFVGPVMRNIDQSNLYYIVTIMGLTGLIVMNMSAKKKDNN